MAWPNRKGLSPEEEKRLSDMKEDRREHYACQRHVDYLQDKLDKNKIDPGETKERLEKRLEHEKEIRDKIEATYKEKYGVQNAQELETETNKLEWKKYGIEKDGKEKPKGGKGDNDGPEAQTVDIPTPPKDPNIGAAEDCVKKMKAAQEESNYKAMEEEAKKLRELSQELAREAQEKQQRLDEVRYRSRGNRDGVPQHPDIVKARGADKNLTHGEMLEKYKKMYDEQQRGRNHDRDR